MGAPSQIQEAESFPVRTRIVQLFRRITSSGDFIPEIDGLRFLAIAGVLVAHIYSAYRRNLPDVLEAGACAEGGLIDTALSTAGRGVELFFIISGFILATPFIRHYVHSGKPISLVRYFKRRITRLEPPYVLVMVAFFILKGRVVGGAEAGSGHNLLQSLTASIFYVHNIVFGEPSYVNGVAWSLEVEVQFYILAPLLAWMILRQPARVRGMIYVTGIIGFTFLQSLLETQLNYPISKSRLSIIGTIQFFLMGFALADLYLAKKQLKLPAVINLPLGLVLLFVMFLVPLRQAPVVNSLLFLGAAMLFYWLVLSPGVWQRLFRCTPLVLIGGMCYSIYLIHFPIMVIASRRLAPVVPVEHFGICFLMHLGLVLVPVMICSAVVFLLIEKPCMRPNWPGELMRMLRRPAGDVSPSKP